MVRRTWDKNSPRQTIDLRDVRLKVRESIPIENEKEQGHLLV
jgi:hypothetical protein